MPGTPRRDTGGHGREKAVQDPGLKDYVCLSVPRVVLSFSSFFMFIFPSYFARELLIFCPLSTADSAINPLFWAAVVRHLDRGPHARPVPPHHTALTYALYFHTMAWHLGFFVPSPSDITAFTLSSQI